MEYKLKLKTFVLKVNESVNENEITIINCSEKANEILKKIFDDLDDEQEHFVVLLLNNRLKLKAYKVLFSGGITETIVDQKVLFRTILITGATGFIIAHNHPSGEVEPSKDDIELTEKIKKISELVDVKFYDHIILSKESYFSFRDKKLL